MNKKIKSKKKQTIKKVAKAVKKTAKKKVVKKTTKVKANNKPKAKKTTKTIVTTVTTTTTTTQKQIPIETHYLLILDKSGSMGVVRDTTLKGLNEQIQEIKNLEKKYPNQKYFISLVTFDSEVKNVFVDVPSNKMKELTKDDYIPGGMTALHDAIGVGITTLKSRIQSKLDNNDATALVVIMTDGEENTSKDYTASKVKELILDLEKTKLWTFSFIGANQDAILTAKEFGISTSNAINYTSSIDGTATAYAAVTNAISARAFNMSSGNFSTSSFISNVVDGENLGESTKDLKSQNINSLSSKPSTDGSSSK